MHDGELAAAVRGLDRGAQRPRVERRDVHAVGAAVVVHDLDVVRAFGDARVDERLRGLWHGQRGDADAVLGAVAARRGDQRTRGEQVRPARYVAGRLLRAQRVREVRIGEHVQLGRHAEHQRIAQCIAERVRVRVDQAGQQRLPRRVHDLRIRGWRDGRTDLGDPAVAHEHARALDHAGAVEHPGVAEEDGARLRRPGRCVPVRRPERQRGRGEPGQRGDCDDRGERLGGTQDSGPHESLRPGWA